jgi:uncharacterized membrane protein SpoIIM required for sporulation
MREAAFIHANKKKWKEYESFLELSKNSPDQTAEVFINVVDDLAYARTFYPDSRTAEFLNSLAMRFHQRIYKNKKERSNRVIDFWKYELPLTMASVRKQLLYATLFFLVAVLIGVLSTSHDATFARLILGDNYVNETISNIKKNDPMAIYKSMNQTDMFFMITLNNIRVSFYVFVGGIFLSIGTVFLLFSNGVMLGTFQYFFYQYNLLLESALTIWIHGTLEISAIVIAGAAGIVMGNSILFPNTYTRLTSFRYGAKKGLKIIVGLVPIFITAGFLESFITRLTDAPVFVKLLIIGSSFAFILYYFVIYPYRLQKIANGFTNEKKLQ